VRDGGLGDGGAAKAETPAEHRRHSRRERAAAAQNLRHRCVIGAEIARKSPERIARITAAAIGQFRLKLSAKMHEFSYARSECAVNEGARETGANPRVAAPAWAQAHRCRWRDFFY
jgi:hypothetical protein